MLNLEIAEPQNSARATFAQFWAAYPRRVAKKDAEKAWMKLTEGQRFEAMQWLPLHIRYWQVAGRTKETTPHPATWLNGERWTDELEMPEVAATDGGWWKTTAGISAKAQAVGITPRVGEDWHSLKARILAKERAA